MKPLYFHRVHALSPTKFWINNPTPEETRLAIDAGALGCTHNPSHGGKLLENATEAPRVMELLKEAVRRNRGDDDAATDFQRMLVKPTQEAFFPLWERSKGTDGYVSIQGDPVHEDDPDTIIREAYENRKLGENIAIKIPCTEAGLKAIETLVPEGYPINATEIMSISQGIALCETYERVAAKHGKRPILWLSFIAGIYDEYLENYVKSEGVDMLPDLVHQAGMATCRKMYRILQDRRYSAIIIGGGARHLRHFTEMVGGDVVVTINWKGTADALIREDSDVVHRFECPVPPLVIDELLRKLPDFRRGWEAEGLAPEEYEHFGPVVLFRSMFLNSWNYALSKIKELRGTVV